MSEPFLFHPQWDCKEQCEVEATTFRSSEKPKDIL